MNLFRVRPRCALVFAVWVLMFSSILRGQTGGGFDLSFATVDGGGGRSSGGAFVLIGVVGQPDSGTSSGGSFRLAGGFIVGSRPVATPTPMPTPTPEASPAPTPLIALDFARDGNLDGWQSVRIGSAFPDAVVGDAAVAGLCIFTPTEGNNIAVWESPRSRAIPLVRNSVYRIRFGMSTNQNVGSAQPVWNILIDNLNPDTGEIIWGAERWFFSNVEFANGIGNSGFDGLTQFEAWIVPNPVTTDAWNGLVDFPNSPFAFENQSAAAFNIKYRILDVDPIPGATTEDSGNVCLRDLQVTRFPITDLVQDGGPVWGSVFTVPEEIRVLVAAASGPDFVPSGALVEDTFGSGRITVELDEPPAAAGGIGVARAFVQFEDFTQQQDGNLRFYPVPWNDHELLRLTSEIRASSAVATNPVDVITLGWQTATNELGGFDFSFRGQPGALMDRAASPRDDSVANSTYTSFFYTHHSTDVDPGLIPDANRLRGVLDFFNRTDLAGAIGEGNLSDPLVIRSMAIHRIVYDENVFGPRPAE